MTYRTSRESSRTCCKMENWRKIVDNQLGFKLVSAYYIYIVLSWTSPDTLVKDWKFGLWQVFGLWGRKVYFEVLITVWSKNRVILSLKTAQNLNFKVRNPLKMINFVSKWTPIYTMFWRFFDFWSLKWKLCFLYMILEIKLFFMFLLRISANLQKCWENHTKSKFLGCAGPSRW